jgi:cell division protein FtsW
MLSTADVSKMEWRQIIFDVLLWPIIGIFLILISRDAGTAMITGIIIIGILYLVNFNKKKLWTIVLICLILSAALFLFSSNKMARLMAVLNPSGCDPQGACYQTNQASYAMANGGIFGVGLGASKEKWLRLSEADNDFIFAIIGEELGLIGCLIVIILFILIGISLINIVKLYSVSNAPNNVNNVHNFESIFATGIFLWFLSQSFLNIAMVLQLFPVVGIPLPFVSAGGSSMMASILAIGILFKFIPQYSKQHILTPFNK